MAQARGPQCNSPTGAAKWSEVIGRDAAVGRAQDLHAGVIWYVLNSVERYVAKVSLVADPIAAPQTGFAVSEHIVSKSDARAHRPIARVPHLSDRAVRRDLHRTTAHSLVGVSAASEIKIGIELLISVVLHAIELVAQPVVKSEFPGKLPIVLCVDGPVVVTETTGETGCGRRQSNSASGGLHHSACGILDAGELPLRIDRRLDR